jgi:hypothetical protein
VNYRVLAVTGYRLSRHIDKTTKNDRKLYISMIIKNRIKSKISPILRTSLLAFFILSCAHSSNAYREIDNAVSRDNFTHAVDVVVRGQRRANAIYSERNAIMLFLDKGLLEHYAKNYAASGEDLQNAERLIEEAYTKSVSEDFLSYIINDNTKAYPGEDFENIYLNVFNALNYYNRGNIEGALVEIRKLSNTSGKLDMLARRYEYTDPRTGESLNTRVRRETGVSEMPQIVSVNFSNSALARYLGALFYQGEGNTDAARIEFEQLQNAFSTNRKIYYYRMPGAAEDARDIPQGLARLNIISFTGLSPIKEEQMVLHYLPFNHPILRVASFRLPVLVKRPSRITRIEAVVAGEGSFQLELLEDMGKVIEETFAARYSSILLKTYIRTIIKYAVADIAAAVATESSNEYGELRGLMTAVAARLAMDASESADIRMSRYLPDKAYIGGINLENGVYSVIINYYSGNTVISSVEYTDVTVESGRLNLLESVNLR